MADNIPIDYNLSLQKKIYDILYKWITEDEKQDTREGIEAFDFNPIDIETEEESESEEINTDTLQNKEDWESEK